MSLRILVDMNLTPLWTVELMRHGHDALHWSDVGDPRASDNTIMDWARTNGHVVLTHDLDFGTLLALTHANGPSVLQVRSQNVLPEHMAHLVLSALARYQDALKAGALIVIEEKRARVRVLPL